ncbi:ABC transporter permease [Spirosoma panaciterrae]|uniref:ABC transporter permease n=1 Tax=Spirosoma panaciterrae TaxID=496058 RepID=UPI00036D347F|nr:ABC transporter permease [Spirosoma panaciterrae]
MPSPTPPRFATYLLHWFLAAHRAEELEGDLDELFQQRVREVGLRKARWRYIRDVVSLMRPSLIKRQTVLDFPGPTHTAMFRNYFKIAWRNLLRSPGLSTINIVGLSIGLAAVMFILLFVQDEVSYDRFHAHGDRLYRVVLNGTSPEGNEIANGATGLPQGPAFAAGMPEVTAFCRVKGYEMLVRQNQDVEYHQVMYVDTSFFDLFSFKLLAGNPRTLLNDPGSVVITDDMARTYFGTTDVLNKLLAIDAGGNFENYRITGVVKTPPTNSSLRFDLLRPFVASLSPDQKAWAQSDWSEGFLNTFLLLKPDMPTADLQTTEQKMATIFEKYAGQQLAQLRQEQGAFRVAHQLQPFLSMHLDDRYELSNGLERGSSSVYSYVLSGIAGLILLLAGINFINLTLARSLRRTKEIGIRKVTGSTRQQLIGQFVGETFLLTLLAFVPALILVYVLLPQFSTLANKALTIQYLLTPQTVGLFAALIVLVTALAGFYPARVLSGFNPAKVLYGRSGLVRSYSTGKPLLVLQFVIAITLLIGTAVLHGQFRYIQTANVGYERADRVRMYIPWGRERQGELLKQALQNRPGIEAVARKSGGHRAGTYYIRNKAVKSGNEWVDDQYLHFVNIPILKGRGLRANSPADSQSNILVNETFAKRFLPTNQSAIGQVVQRQDEGGVRHDLTVVGVVRDYQYRSLRDKPEPVLFQLGRAEQMNQLYVRLNPTQMQAGLQTIEQAYRQIIPFQPFSYHFMEDDRLNDYADDARWKELMTDAALLAILIAGLGLFGMVTLTVEQRTKEIGVRKVLGASVLEINRMLSGSFLKLVLVAFLIAVPIGWYASRQWLDTFVYRMDLSGWLFISVGLSVLFFALLTVSFQSIKAALMNPVKSLRSE